MPHFFIALGCCQHAPEGRYFFSRLHFLTCIALLLLAHNCGTSQPCEDCNGVVQDASFLPRKKEAFVTLATDAQFVVAAMVFAHSLRRTNTTREIICIVTSSVSDLDRFRLQSMFDRVIEVAPVDSVKADSQFGMHYLHSIFSKLRVLTLTEYNVVVYADADMIARRNIDELFGCPPPCATLDMALWEVTELGPTINVGLMVLRPSIADFEALQELATKEPWDRTREYVNTAECFLADQQRCCEPGKTWVGPFESSLFNIYYNHNFTVLPYFYNFMPVTMIPWRIQGNRKWAWHPDKVKIIHYALIKPWVASAWEPELEHFRQMWLDVLADMEDSLRQRRLLPANIGLL
mmetsp:Transcript_8551/g.14486  ORF Transcript_8551/g.14486 Transcript_8551/m.14486 type:complete len:349 (+) Transcript_8551:54-1100(+)